MKQYEVKKISIGNETLAYRASGAGETVVLVHGNMSSSVHWQTTMEHLEDRYRVVAVDLPSGLEGDSSRAFPSFHANLTVTFGGRKACQVLQPAAAACGRVVVVDIGLDLADPLLAGWEASDVAARYPWPGARSDKYSRGALGIDKCVDILVPLF